jgi:phosphoglycerate dehydrogenase-like enzyme
MSSLRVLVTCPQLQRTFEDYRHRFDDEGVGVALPPVVQQLSEAEMMAIIGEFDGIIVGDDPLTAPVLARADRLKVISKWGVGIDNIDLDVARARGIVVTNTPGVFGDEVADVVLGYLILLARKLHVIDRSVRSGGWPKIEGISLTSRRLGVVGLGSIGQAVARRGLALGMRVAGHDVATTQQEAARALGVEILELDDLLRETDVVSLNCPLTRENRHLLDERRLAMLPRGAWVINTARGPLIDESALIAAIRSGQIGAAALDVFEAEPLPGESPLRAMDNVILGAHNASNTADAGRRVSELAITNVLAGLGRPV